MQKGAESNTRTLTRTIGRNKPQKGAVRREQRKQDAWSGINEYSKAESYGSLFLSEPGGGEQIAKDGTAGGGARAGAWRRPKALADKTAPGKRAEVLTLPEPPQMEGVDVPSVKRIFEDAPEERHTSGRNREGDCECWK